MSTVKQVAEAFAAGNSATCGNAKTDGCTCELHGNRIAAHHVVGKVLFNWCGWYTPTTANHMNEILRAMGAQIRVSASQAKKSGQTTFVV